MECAVCYFELLAVCIPVSNTGLIYVYRIDFHQLAKPANLKNSAVLRMLEEEEHRKRHGQPPSK